MEACKVDMVEACKVAMAVECKVAMAEECKEALVEGTVELISIPGNPTRSSQPMTEVSALIAAKVCWTEDNSSFTDSMEDPTNCSSSNLLITSQELTISLTSKKEQSSLLMIGRAQESNAGAMTRSTMTLKTGR